MIKKFKIYEQMDDPFNEEIDDEGDINIPNIYDFYFNHHDHYSVFNGNNYEVNPMERRDGYYDNNHRYNGTLYLGLRESGDFFAYDRKYVWVFLSNSNENKRRMRHQRGFCLTITTVDDSALYADWNEPLTEEQLKKVVDYFDFYTKLDTDMNILRDLEDIIKQPCADFSTS